MSLPSLSHRTELDFRWDIVDGIHSDYYDDVYHPALKHLDRNMHLISKSLFTNKLGEPASGFNFDTVEEFNVMIQKLENTTKQEHGS